MLGYAHFRVADIIEFNLSYEKNTSIAEVFYIISYKSLTILSMFYLI